MQRFLMTEFFQIFKKLILQLICQNQLKLLFIQIYILNQKH